MARYCKNCGKRLRMAEKFCSKKCITTYKPWWRKFLKKLTWRLSWFRLRVMLSNATTTGVTKPNPRA